MNYQEDLCRGQVAECFFSTCGANFLSLGTIMHPEDLRGLNKEGEYLFNGKLTEVKSDWGNAVHSGNVCVQVLNYGNPAGTGWLSHCIQNGVELICYVLYKQKERKEDCIPSAAVLIPLHVILSVLEDDPEQIICPKRCVQKGLSVIRLIPINLIKTKPGVHILRLWNYDWLRDEHALVEVVKEALHSFGLDAAIEEEGAMVYWQKTDEST